MTDVVRDELLSALLSDGFRYAMSLTHDIAKAEDVLQDAWLAVLKANGPHQKSYLFSAIKSRFINQYRRELLVPITAIDDEFIGGAEQIEGMKNINIDSLINIDLEKILATLRPSEREALYLSAVEGFSAREISEQTEQPRGTILNLIYRAKQKLRKSFSEQIHEAKK